MFRDSLPGSTASIRLINFHRIDHTSAIADVVINEVVVVSDVLYQKWFKETVGLITMPGLCDFRKQVHLWPDRARQRPSSLFVGLLGGRVAQEFDKWLVADTNACDNYRSEGGVPLRMPSEVGLETEWYE